MQLDTKMKVIKNSLILGLTALTFLGISTHSVKASSIFTGNANLSYTITSIINQTSPGTSFNNILYSGSSVMDAFSGSIITGNGNVTPTYSSDPIPTTQSALSANFSFTESMLIDGTVSNGDIDSFYLNTSDIFLHNISTDTYVINYTVDYNLSVLTSGEFADATLSLSDINLGIPGNYVEAYSNSLISNSATVTDSLLLSITLGAGTTTIFSSELAFSGTAVASASPVPIPGAVWLFSAGLMALFRFKKITQ